MSKNKRNTKSFKKRINKRNQKQLKIRNMRKETSKQLEDITVNYPNLSYLQMMVNEIIKLNNEDWGNSNHKNEEKIHECIQVIHSIISIEDIGKIRFHTIIDKHPQMTLLLNPHLMCDISNDGEHYNFILFPMRNNSSESYPPINYYQQRISEGKLNEEKFEMIVKEMGVGVTQRDCGYTMMKLERVGIIESKTKGKIGVRYFT